MLTTRIHYASNNFSLHGHHRSSITQAQAELMANGNNLAPVLQDMMLGTTGTGAGQAVYIIDEAFIPAAPDKAPVSK